MNQENSRQMATPITVARIVAWVVFTGVAAATAAEPADSGPVEVTRAAIHGAMDGEKARLVIEADLGGLGGRRVPALYGAAMQQTVRVLRDRLEHSWVVKVDALRGGLREVVLPVWGPGEILSVAGDGLEDWSVRQAAGGDRALVLRVRESDRDPVRSVTVEVTAAARFSGVPAALEAMGLGTEEPALANGYLRVETAPALAARVGDVGGLVPVEAAYLPEAMRPPAGAGEGEILAFRFFGSRYRLPLEVSLADPEARQVVLAEYDLDGDLRDERAVFTLTAVARVRNPKGGTLALLSGDVALRSASVAGARLRFREGRYEAVFDAEGDYPVRLEFDAAVRGSNAWNRARFTVATGTPAPVRLRGLGEGTELEVVGGSRPEWDGAVRRLHLGADGDLELRWRPARLDTEGRLFFATDAVTQVGVSPGLLRLTTLWEWRVMQGELNEAILRLRGAGEITRVQGPQVLAWSLDAMEDTADRRLRVRFNQPQREQAAFQVQVQAPLGAFPLTIEVPSLEPEGATRFAGQVRVINEGAVRLEVLEATGLSQISPEHFVQTEATRDWMPAAAGQVFAYRFAGGGARLRVRADNILPELSVSQVTVYRLGETEVSVEAGLEVEVREAPLRELLLRFPAGFSVAGLQAAGLADYFVAEGAEGGSTSLRLVYAQPVTGRQIVQLRLERNRPLTGTRWDLPRVEVEKAKSMRGHVGVVAEAGFRLTPATTSGLTEVATAFFPRKIPGLQAGFRLSDAAWAASLAVERLEHSVQADAFHLFSVGEGIAYGSSLINYVVSGAPVATLAVELSGEYANVEFTGKNVRNVQKTERGYEVQLHTPVAGAYTLLGTYERPFQARGETLGFAGARPLGVQSEQGYTLVVSTYQFEVRPVDVSPTLLPLEPGEVPAEYRLFFDAPILAAYRYAARPFSLQLALAPLTQGEVVSQVVDRAVMVTRISAEGQVVTDARYFVKNKGAPHLRLRLPAGAELWSVLVDGATAVPVRDGEANLIPLPHRADPDVVTEVQVTMASRSATPRRLSVAAPVVGAPVLLADWRLEPGTGHRLVYRGGTLTPESGRVDLSGFTTLWRAWTGADRGQVRGAVAVIALSVGVGALVWSGVLGGRGRRWSGRHLASGVIGLGACAVAVTGLVQLGGLVADHESVTTPGLHFVAPVQQGGSAWSVVVDHFAQDAFTFPILSTLVLVAAALGIWIYTAVTERDLVRQSGGALGWTVLFWAALRLDHGAVVFLAVTGLFLGWHFLRPAAMRWWISGSAAPVPVTAGAALGVLLVLGLGWGGPQAAAAQTATGGGATDPAWGVADSVRHEVIVEEDGYVFGRARLRWTAREGELLPILEGPAVLTRAELAPGRARLVPMEHGGRRRDVLVAQADGGIDVDVAYQTRVTVRGEERGFVVPVPAGMVQEARLTLRHLDVEVLSPQAVSVVREESEATSSNTVATLVLKPVADTWIGWKPRSRDTRRERAVYFAEWVHVVTPASGVVDGIHEAQIRPAQGEVTELGFEVPPGATVTDVASPALAFWRFDPDARRLRVSLSPAQSRPFVVTVRSQVTGGTLPMDREVGLPRVDGAAGQVGLVGVATGAEVQLDEVTAEGFAAINLEDFPARVVEPLAAQVSGLAVRRAFRHGDGETGRLRLKASAVEPDVRVEARQTLSLGEDRTVLAAVMEVEVLRAGIFKLSFGLPAGLELESASGPSMSHWTELKDDAQRWVTLHLQGKTLGRHTFHLTLAGGGVKATNGWDVPRLAVREASKQRGQLLVVPEQGLRLQVATREGVTQLDPEQAEVRQKGVLAFRLLQEGWRLALDIDQVDAWIQVTSLQHVVFTAAQVRVTANLQYEIANTGVKSFGVRLPAAADGVRFSGELVGDFLAAPAADGALTRDWEVRLERRVLGRHRLLVSYTLPLVEEAREAVVEGVEALGVQLQRGFVTLQAGGRLQVRAGSNPALQSTEWQVIPRFLLQDLAAPSASYTYRLVEPAFRLPVQLDRHEAARLLPARVQQVALNSVVSDDGAMLTQVRMELAGGDKRLLRLRLPEGARFWFAFVDQRSVWPWQATNQVLLPLERGARPGGMTTVEFFYSSQAGRAGRRTLSLALQGPRFDLPLEDITWTVSLNEKWQVEHWDGSLQLLEAGLGARAEALDLDSYIRNETQIRQEKTRDAEQFLNLANTLLQQGDPGEARRAFQAAFGLSQHDQAFNEDARVQLNNLRMQQALVGLNVRRARVAGATDALAAAPRGLRESQATAYTQAEAKQFLDRVSAEDNAVQERLAERLIQQQDAAVASPAAIRTALPEQGRRLTFKRPLQVDTWSDLSIDLEATAAGSVSWGGRLLGLALGFLVIAGLLRWCRPQAPSEG